MLSFAKTRTLSIKYPVIPLSLPWTDYADCGPSSGGCHFTRFTPCLPDKMCLFERLLLEIWTNNCTALYHCTDLSVQLCVGFASNASKVAFMSGRGISRHFSKSQLSFGRQSVREPYKSCKPWQWQRNARVCLCETFVGESLERTRANAMPTSQLRSAWRKLLVDDGGVFDAQP